MLKISIQNIVTARNGFSMARAAMSTATVEHPKFFAMIRDEKEQGSRKSRALRLVKNIPGVLYGTDDDFNVLKTVVKVNQKDLTRELRLRGQSFENTIYELNVLKAVEGTNEDGTPKTEVVSKYLVTPRQTQFAPITEFPVSVNFLRYRPGNRVRIPVDYKNADQSQDLKRGCFLVRVHNFVECVCDGPVPAKIIVDLADVKKGDILKLSAKLLPPQVRPAKTVSLDYVLGVIQSTRG